MALRIFTALELIPVPSKCICCIVARVGSVSTQALHDEPTLAKSVLPETATVVVSWSSPPAVRTLAIFTGGDCAVRSPIVYGMRYTPDVAPTYNAQLCNESATPEALRCPISAKTRGKAACASAFATMYTAEPVVPTKRSPFGENASSRAPATFPTISILNPLGTVRSDAGCGDGPAGVAVDAGVAAEAQPGAGEEVGFEFCAGAAAPPPPRPHARNA